MIPSLRAWLAMLTLAAATLPASAGVRPSVEQFFENPSFNGARLSPSSRYLAVRMGAPDQRERLAVFDLAAEKMKVVAQFHDADIGNFEWVNDERLVFDAHDRTTGAGDVRLGPGLWAVDRDGSDFKQLVHTDPYADTQPGTAKAASISLYQPAPKVLAWNHFLATRRGPQDGDDVYVLNPHYGTDGVDVVELRKLNTRTGRSSFVDRPDKTQDWFFDAQGEPRLAVVVDKDRESLHYLDKATGKWRKVAEYPAYLRSEMWPAGFAPDGSLYVTSTGGHDTEALYKLDLATGRLAADPLLRIDGFDVDADLVVSDKLLGVRYVADAPSTAWLDPKMRALQAQVDKLLPATVNRISAGARPQAPFVLVVSESDQQPPAYRIYNSDTGAIKQIGQSLPRLDPLAMARVQFVRYKARDGMVIPAWLTLPRDKPAKNLPMVVLVHGGPFVRGRAWGWDTEAQFLASRGYAVLQPEFRGSTGFGFSHFQAGWKQWGLKMQDDLADGARWAIGSGLADQKRICIAGASYGGYAALMGLVNDPNLYQCAVNWVGATDIGLLYSGFWGEHSDITARQKRYAMPEVFGDPVKDAAQIKATSPIENAARVTRPVLLAYGGSDRRVPLVHGEKFRKAVSATNKDVEWIVYGEEGHGFVLPQNRIDFWTRVEAFLDRHIGH